MLGVDRRPHVSAAGDRRGRLRERRRQPGDGARARSGGPPLHGRRVAGKPGLRGRDERRPRPHPGPLGAHPQRRRPAVARVRDAAARRGRQPGDPHRRRHRPADPALRRRPAGHAGRLRHGPHAQLAPPRPRLGRGRPRAVVHRRPGLRRDRRRLALPPRGARRRGGRGGDLRLPLPLLPRGRRALLPPARAGVGGDLRAGGRLRAPPLQPPGAALGDAGGGQPPLAEESLPPAALSPDGGKLPPHPPPDPGPRPGGARLGGAARALLARRLRLALAEPPGDPPPAPPDPGAADRAAGGDRPLVRAAGRAPTRSL